MKKIIIQTLLLVVICLLFVAQPVFAAISGNIGSTITWTLDETTGTLTLSGSGTISSATWSNYKSQIKEIIIGNGITTISPNIFKEHPNLEKVHLPSSINTIYANAFASCPKLHDVYIEDWSSWYNIWMPSDGSPLINGANLYVNGELLTEAVITSESLSYFFPLKNCTSLKKVTFTNGSVIPDNFLSGCTALEEVVIRESIWYIGKNAFANCKSLQEITLPKGTSTIEDYAFSGCTGLTEFIFPDKVPVIDIGVFSGCVNLEKIQISSASTVHTIYSNAFKNCKNLKDFTIPSTIKKIDTNAFFGCESLISINIPATVTTIGTNPFEGCINLTKIQIDEENTSFVVGEDYGLYTADKSRLISLVYGKTYDTYTMPATVTTFDQGAFTGLQQIFVDPQNTTYTNDEYGVLYSQDMKKLYVFPSDSKLTTYNLLDSITIQSGAFSQVKNLQTLYVSLNATIYQAGFTGILCKPVVYVAPSSLSEKVAVNCGFEVRYGGYINKDIQWNFSDDCLQIFGSGYLPSIQKTSYNLPWYFIQSNIRKIIVEDGIAGLGEKSFYGLQNLEKVIIADSVKTISSECFKECLSLTDIALGNGVEKLGYYAFKDCTAIESIFLPASITSIDRPFSGCISLNTIEISDIDKFQQLSTDTVFDNHDAILYCNGEAVLHPIISTGQSCKVYTNAKFIESLTYAEGVTSMDLMTNIYAKKLILSSTIKTFLNLGPVMTEIEIHSDNPYLCAEDNVIYNREKSRIIYYPNFKEDTTFIIPYGVSVIGDGSFASNNFLTEIIVPETVQTIEKNAFRYCNFLQNVSLSEGLLTIKEYAFEYTKIETLFIPESVQEITNLGIKPTIEGYDDTAAYQYAQQKGLTFISIDVSNKTIDYGDFGDNLRWRISKENILYITGNGTIPDYSSPTDVPWHNHMGWIERIIIEEGITAIGSNSFSDFTGKKHIIVLGDIVSVGKNAFAASEELTVCGYGTNALQNFATSNGITYITMLDCGFASPTIQWIYTEDNRLLFVGNGYMQNWAKTQDTPWYSYKKNIVAVEIPEGIKNIGAWSLSGCSSLTSLVIPNSVEYICDYSLNGCSSLQELTLPFIGCERGGENKQSSVFGSIFGFLGVGGSASLSGATVQRYTESMDKGTFIGAFIPDSIKKVTITDESFIAYGAFYNCKFEEIVLPEGITHISPYAFYNSAAKITYPGTAKAWERIEIGDHNTINLNITGVDHKTNEPTISVTDVAGGKKITIEADGQASVYYTIDGSLPTYRSNKYEGEIYLLQAGEYEIKAIAIQRGYDESYPISEMLSVPKAEMPFASAESGLTPPGTLVTLHTNLDDASIFYTLDDSMPDNNSILYSSPIEINGFVKLRAIVVKEGWANSEVSLYHYVDEYAIPAVATKDAFLVSNHSAILQGEIHNRKDLSFYDVEFVYYPKDNPANSTTLTADETFSCQLENLTEDTKYCYYIKVTNGDKISHGEIKEFCTKTYEIPLKVTLNHEGIRLQNGREYQLNATVYPQTALNQQINWRSSNQKVATIDKNGVVKAVGVGNAIITATAQDGGVFTSCEILVYNKYVTDSVDISELNIATNTQYYAEYGFTHPDKTEAGNNSYALAYFTRWDGAVTEKKDKNLSPTASSEYGYELENYYLETDADYHIQNAYIIPIRENSYDNDELKRAIKKYGAVAAIMYAAPEAKYGYGGSSYYYNEGWNWSVGNHLVSLVGWDDNYPASNFPIKPEGNGAFIVKNSWGESYADDGFFYISYYDSILARYTNSYVYPELETNTNYNNIWQYDYTGPSYKLGYTNSTYAANIFPQDGKALANDELLRAVSFHTAAQDMKYEIYVVDNYVDESSLKISSAPVKSGSVHEMGYHTIELDQYIHLAAGNRFAVIVRLIANDGAIANMLVEKLWSVNTNMVRFDNVGFYSANGNEWSEIFSDTNICIKAFTDYADLEKAKNTVYKHNETIDTNSSEITISEAESSYKLTPYHFGGLYPDMMDTIINDFVSDIELPAKYDLRELHQVTKSKDQGGFGLCWCFGSASSVESGVLKRMAEGALNGIDNNQKPIYAEASIQLIGEELHVNATVNATLYIAKYDDLWNFESVEVYEVTADKEKTVPFDATYNTKAFVWDEHISALCNAFVNECN